MRVGSNSVEGAWSPGWLAGHQCWPVGPSHQIILVFLLTLEVGVLSAPSPLLAPVPAPSAPHRPPL